MFSGMFTCQEAGVEQSNLRSALDVALKQGGSLAMDGADGATALVTCW